MAYQAKVCVLAYEETFWEEFPRPRYS